MWLARAYKRSSRDSRHPHRRRSNAVLAYSSAAVNGLLRLSSCRHLPSGEPNGPELTQTSRLSTRPPEEDCPARGISLTFQKCKLKGSAGPVVRYGPEPSAVTFNNGTTDR